MTDQDRAGLLPCRTTDVQRSVFFLTCLLVEVMGGVGGGVGFLRLRVECFVLLLTIAAYDPWRSLPCQR